MEYGRPESIVVQNIVLTVTFVATNVLKHAPEVLIQNISIVVLNIVLTVTFVANVLQDAPEVLTQNILEPARLTK